MVSTRTQDGTISTKTYSPLTLNLNALTLQSPLPSPLRSARSGGGPGSPTKVLKPKSPRKTSRKTPKTPTSAKKQKFANRAASEANASMSTEQETAPASTSKPRTRSTAKVTFAEPIPEEDQEKQTVEEDFDFLQGNTFFPSIAFGEKETVGLSKIGRAEKEVKMWETILAEHREKMPPLVPVVEEKLWEAKNKRACLDETKDENLTIGDVNPAESAIKNRLKALDWALSTSKFAPEAENIKCAIEGYKTGQIGYSDHFTVIYAAHVVDTVATYSEFVRNRNDMLDRYSEIHGPGWMWYEPPLNVHPESLPKSYPSVALERTEEWSALGGWYVRQGFWKRAGWVMRMAQAEHIAPGIGFENYPGHPSNPNLVDVQDQGPRLAFRSILDSGATFPSLYQEDIDSLGINMNLYAAQSVSSAFTASGISTSRIFELFVCVLDNEGKQLVDPNNAVYPHSHKYLGGLCPVSLSIMPMSWDVNGIEICHRLSGVLPFVASYVSSTPTQNTLYLGEDRNSVLGAHRMPGQKKWSIEIPRIGTDLSDDRFGEPKIKFTHRRGKVVDEDDEKRDHVSYLTVFKDRVGVGGRREEVMRVESDPGTKQREMVAEREVDEMVEEARRNIGMGGMSWM